MRVISGEYGGRKLKAVPGKNTRPTTDKVKEAVFNMIGPYFDTGVALDLFAGSGGLAIEAVSRGFSKAILIDRDRLAIQTINSNIAITKEPNKFEVYCNDADRALQLLQKKALLFDLVFLDPPYAKQKIVMQIEKLLNDQLLNEEAYIVCETDKNVLLPEINGFNLLKQQHYGGTIITIYQKGAVM